MTMLIASSEIFVESPRKNASVWFSSWLCVEKSQTNSTEGAQAGLPVPPTSRLAGFAAVGAEAAYFCAGYCDFDAAVTGDLGLELLVEFAFEFADFAAADAGYVDVVARTV